MELQAYIFEAPQGELLINGQPQVGQSQLLEQQDDPNRAPAYARLHLGEVASGAQAIVFYEHAETAGVATLERTATTNGMHDWFVRDTQMTSQGPQAHERKDVLIGTEDPDGFMNRHMFLQPGDTLVTTTAESTARIKTIGTIVSVHLVGIPREPLSSVVPAIINPSSAREFAEAA